MKRMALLSLLVSFTGDLRADCIDLTGRWSCTGRTLTIEQSINPDGAPVYQFSFDGQAASEYIADNRSVVNRTTAFCDPNKLRTVLSNNLPELHGNVRFVTDYTLSDNGRTLQAKVSTTFSLKSDISSIDKQELNHQHDDSCAKN